MKRLFAVVLSAAVMVTILTWFIGGEAFEIRDKQWSCKAAAQRYRCTVSVTLHNQEAVGIKVNLHLRGVPEGSDSMGRIALEEPWLEVLTPGEVRRVERHFTLSVPLQRLAVSALAIEQGLLE